MPLFSPFRPTKPSIGFERPFFLLLLYRVDEGRQALALELPPALAFLGQRALVVGAVAPRIWSVLAGVSQGLSLVG